MICIGFFGVEINGFFGELIRLFMKFEKFDFFFKILGILVFFVLFEYFFGLVEFFVFDELLVFLFRDDVFVVEKFVDWWRGGGELFMIWVFELVCDKV